MTAVFEEAVEEVPAGPKEGEGYEITLSCDRGSRHLLGGGVYEEGEGIVVSALPDAGYRFVHWIEGGEVVETHFDYRFTVDRDRHLVAEFEKR